MKRIILAITIACAASVALGCKNTGTQQEPNPTAPTPPVSEGSASPALATPTTDAASAPHATPHDEASGAISPGEPGKSRVLDLKFKSAALGVTKHAKVYLPASYDAAPPKRYPVFYYLHGLTGDEANWTSYGDMKETADDLKLEAIVVMPDGDDSFYVDAVTPADYDACKQDGTGLLDPSRSKAKTCVKDRKYGTYIVNDLVEWTDKTFRTLGTREGRAIAGLSMGGYGALSLALRFPDKFVAAASHSGVVTLLYDEPIPYKKGKVKLVDDVEKAWGGKLGGIGNWMRSIFGKDLANWQAHDPAYLVRKLGPNAPKLYIDCGTEDEFVLHNHAMYLHDLLLELKVDHEYWIGPGRHDFKLWSKRLPNSLQFLRKHTTPAQPAR